MQAFTPQVAQAATVDINLSIERQPNESYENLIRRAKVVLLAATQQKFSQAVQETFVSAIIVGQNQGAIVPVLSLQVSRPQWRSQSAICKKHKSLCLTSILNRVRYYNDAQVLLGFKDEASKTSSELENVSPETASFLEVEDENDIDRSSPDAIVPVDVPENSSLEF